MSGKLCSRPTSLRLKPVLTCLAAMLHEEQFNIAVKPLHYRGAYYEFYAASVHNVTSIWNSNSFY